MSDQRMDYCLGKFKYLVDYTTKNGKTSPRKRTPYYSVFEYYGGRQNIIDRKLIVIWSQTSYHYYVFDTVSNLKQFLALTPAKDQRYHEVIFSDQIQRPRIDIDGGNKYLSDKVSKILKEKLGPVTVCDLSDQDYFSRHIIVDRYYLNLKQALQACINALGDLYDNQFIDHQVYHDIQNFRLVGSNKGPGTATKKIVTRGRGLEDTLIGQYLP